MYTLLGSKDEGGDSELKLYWFIPDGLRAEPDVFTVFDWAEQGLMPNLKRMMEEGTYGYSIPDFPSHTPVNYATLMTGSHPTVHNVADGPMRLEGFPLEVVSISGFRSNAKKVPPLWYTLEGYGYRSALLSMPGSTPPELSRGVTVKGRWGGWGADFHAINFQEKQLELPSSDEARAVKLFYFGADLHKQTENKSAKNWIGSVPDSHSPALESELVGWGTSVYMYIYDSTDDGVVNYDRAAFSYDKQSLVANLTVGEWSNWLPITLVWETQNDYNIYTPKKNEYERKVTALDVETEVKFRIIKLEESGAYRVRLLYNNLNKFVTKPSSVAALMFDDLGPMVDFVDNFPPQLIYYPEDKRVFLEEAEMSLDWHRNAARFSIEKLRSDAIFHSVYTPNQMLTSRWWLGYVDPESVRYFDVDEIERAKLWEEVKDMYQKIDDIIGEILNGADENTIIVFSSDHGAVALNREVYINNLFAQEGLLTYSMNKETGLPEIDWDKTQAVFLRMDNIYINPEGLGGNWWRSKGEEYEALRDRIIELLEKVSDENGAHPFSSIVKWEDVESFLSLPKDRAGDLVVSNEAGYHWNEELTETGNVFSTPLKTGYKQAILPNSTKALWTPFAIVGPGVKKANRLEEPIQHIQQYPTVMKLLGEEVPEFVQGEAVESVFDSQEN